MYITIKKFILHVFKIFGFLKLAKHFCKNKIRILCYHGVSLNDEHLFMPSSFMTFKTFKERMEYLKENDYKFISLDEAYSMLSQGKVEENCVVVTIDDGFEATFKEMIPFLNEEKIPATNYITTYYTQKDEPIFRLATQYLFWKCKRSHINIQTIGSFEFGDLYEIFDDSSLEVNSENMWKLISYAEKELDSNSRNLLLSHLEEASGVKLSEEVKSSFKIANEELIAKHKSESFDIQLHTHRHHIPKDSAQFQREIDENVEVLSQICEGKEFKHFCYPSGIWNKDDFNTLEKNSIHTATTCELGLAGTKDHLLALPRIIESEAMSMIQFEAEVSGLGDFLRKFKL